MGTRYSTQSVSGYNSVPPPDDGSTIAANQVKWATIKQKITDPVLNLANAINAQLVTALDTSATTLAVNYTTLVSDHQKTIEVTGTTTISLGDAATMGAGYQVPILNAGVATVTVNLANATNTLNGTVNGSLTLAPGLGAMFYVIQAATGYRVQQGATLGAINNFAVPGNLTVTGTVSGTGITALFASPPAIGGTAAAAITGTTITANTGLATAGNLNFTGATAALQLSGTTWMSVATTRAVTINAPTSGITQTVNALNSSAGIAILNNAAGNSQSAWMRFSGTTGAGAASTALFGINATSSDGSCDWTFAGSGVHLSPAGNITMNAATSGTTLTVAANAAIDLSGAAPVIATTATNANLALSPNGTGRVLIQNTTAFHAHLSANQTSGTTIVFDTVDNQTGGTNYANGTGTFTVPVTGWYSVDFYVNYTNNTASIVKPETQLIKNGATKVAVCRIDVPVGDLVGCAISTKLYLTATDTLIVSAQNCTLSATFLVNGSAIVGTAFSAAFIGQ